jgi:hypothetical protein
MTAITNMEILQYFQAIYNNCNVVEICSNVNYRQKWTTKLYIY